MCNGYAEFKLQLPMEYASIYKTKYMSEFLRISILLFQEIVVYLYVCVEREVFKVDNPGVVKTKVQGIY